MRKAYKTPDNKKGFVFCNSKSYGQGNRKKFWFAYRKELVSKIASCPEQYVVFGCGTEGTLSVPVAKLEAILDNLNYSVDKDGKPKYWHIVLFKNREGNMTQMLSKPLVQEIPMDEYLI